MIVLLLAAQVYAICPSHEPWADPAGAEAGYVDGPALSPKIKTLWAPQSYPLGGNFERPPERHRAWCPGKRYV